MTVEEYMRYVNQRHRTPPMLGESLYQPVLHGDDVGTRLEHMMQLQDLWSTVYGILTRTDLYHTALEQDRAIQLRVALDLLQHHMSAEFDETAYAREINDLPRSKSQGESNYNEEKL